MPVPVSVSVSVTHMLPPNACVETPIRCVTRDKKVPRRLLCQLFHRFIDTYLDLVYQRLGGVRKGLLTPQTRVFFCCGNSAADISKPHTFKWGTLADDVFPSVKLHAASKTSSANGSHLNVWGFYISAAEFPQQKKRASLV